MAFPPGFLDELRARLPLAELVGRHVRLTRKGREYAGLCPFHNEKTPSFYVVDDKNFFHCFGCGAHGDAIGFVMRSENLDFIEAVERLAGEAGLAVPQQTPQERERAQRQKTQLEALAAAAEFYEGQLWSAAGRRARDYLTARGLDDETIRRFRLGWAPDDRQTLRRALGKDFPEPLLVESGLIRMPEHGGNPYDYFHARVMFPIGDRAGRTIAFGGRVLGDEQPKYLNSPDTPLFEKGRVLYAWAAARANVARDDTPAGAVIVTEGYMDVIALHRAGFPTAVAPLGTALTETQLHELWRLSAEPVLCFDGDSAGQRAALRALRRALPLLKPGRSLRFAALPPGEDPDSLIRAAGSPAFGDILAAAKPLSEVLWQSEFAARPINTPERRADLKSRLQEDCKQITDADVQREYRSAMFDRYYGLVRSARQWQPRGPRGQPRNRPETAAGLAEQGGSPPPPRPAARLQREVLLSLLIEFPALIEQWTEEIAELEFPEPELDRLRWELLEVAESNPGLDADGLRQHLALCGFAEAVGVLSTRMTHHAGFAAGGGDVPDVLKFGLTEMFQLLRGQGPGDVAAAERAFAVDPSEENEQRLRALKEREFQDGPIGGSGW
jgi:DNA primase